MIKNGVIRTKFLAAKTIILNGGSIKLTDNTNIVQSNDGKTVINNDGDTLYCLKVPHDGSYELDVKKSGIPYKKYSFTAHHEGDDNYYIWLPTGEYDIDNGTKTCSINLEAYDLNLENIPLLIPNLKKITREGNGIITLSPDSLFEFTETGYSQYHELSNTNVYYTYSGNKYIFIGNTNAGIDFKPAFPADTIIIRDLTIEKPEDHSLAILTEDDIVLLIEGEIIFNSNRFTVPAYPGCVIEKSCLTSLLTIDGPGTLDINFYSYSEHKLGVIGSDLAACILLGFVS